MPNIVKIQRIAKRPVSLTACPCGPDGLSFATYWYRLPGIDSFFICSRCFEDKLANTPFASLFESFYNEPLPGTKSICDFNSARIDQILAHAIRSCNMDPLFAFAEHRSTVLPCHGAGGTRGGHGLRWYYHPELSGFVCCEACYQDYLLATPFASRFIPHPHVHPIDEVWVCDMSTPYVRRSLLEHAKTGDWNKFANEVNYRTSLPMCEPDPVVLSSRKWFRPNTRWSTSKITVCEACYLDHFGSLDTAYNMQRVHLKVSQLQDQALCSFKIRSMQACAEQLLQHNFGRWHDLADKIMSKPSCLPGPIEGQWYTLPDPRNSSRNVPNFDICAACYVGYVEATGHEDAFRRVTYPPDTPRVCDFSPGTPRFPKFMQKWSHMVFAGDVRPLADYATRITRIAPCPRSREVVKTRWWGMDEFYFCAECFEEIGKGSYFAPMLNYQAAILPHGRCDMHSDNMRRRYLEACRHRSLDDFIHYCRYREGIWRLMKQEVQRHKMLLKAGDRAHSQGRLLTSYSHADPGTAMVSARPDLGRHRRLSAPTQVSQDHRMTEENLKRAQRKAMRESMQKSPTLTHLQLKWSEVE